MILLIWLIGTTLSCQQSKAMKHVFYLHGMIVSVQGIHAVSEEFGPYEYESIIDALHEAGYEVHAEVRTTQTDFDAFCRRISGQIDQLVSEGTSPRDITVIGASMGGLMAMQISDLNTHPVNYVLLGANSDRNEKNYDWHLHGRILGIYEASDQIAGKEYTYWIDRSPEAEAFEQKQIHTGLGHGFLYTPHEAWMGPTREWIQRE
jgi:esterase/lipase